MLWGFLFYNIVMKCVSANQEDIIVLYDFNKRLINEYEDLTKIDYDYVLKWIYHKIEKHIDEYYKVYLDDICVAYYRFILVDGKMELDDLYVLEAYRNQGIGTKIVQKCINSTDLPVYLYFFRKNYRAVKLYERLGFKIVDEIKDSRYIMEYQR